MSQKKTEEVLSHGSNVIPTNHQRKFAHLPLFVFKQYTNVRQLVVDRRKAKSKSLYEFAIAKTIESYHARLLQLDEWDHDILNKLEFIDWPEDNKIDASIWSLSRREQKRIFAAATDHQKQFLCLPLHVFKNATNIHSLLDDCYRSKTYNLEAFILDIHKNLPKVTKWLPQLNNLKFKESTDLNTSQADLTVQSSTRTSAIPNRESLRVRKTNINYNEEKQRLNRHNEDAKPRSSKRIRTQSETSETDPLAQFAAYKRSKIPRIETKRHPQIVSFVPNKLQREVQNMNLEQFATKTNIKEIIEKEYRERLMNENAVVPDGELKSRLAFYFAFRIHTREWHKNGLNHLELMQPIADEAIADATNETDDRTKLDASNSNSATDQKYEPTDFQKQVMAMDFDTFVTTTNVKELVIYRFEQEFKGTKEIDEKFLNYGLKRYFSLRKKPEKWHKNLLMRLQIIPKVCECRQNKTFDDKFTQTDPVKTDDGEVQCDPSELDGNEMVESGQMEQQHQTLEAKLAKLRTNTCNEYVPMVYETNEEDSNITDDLSMDDPQDIDLNAGATNSNLAEPTNEPIQSAAQSEQGTTSKQSEDFIAENLLETQEISQNVNDDVAMTDEQQLDQPMLKGVDNLQSSDDNVNASAQQVDLVEKSAEPSSNEVVPRLVVEGIQQESFEMTNMEVELNPENQPQSQSKTSIAMVLSPSKIEVDASTQPENSTNNPIEAKIAPTNGTGDNSMDGFDPQKNSTAVDLSVNEESVNEEVQEVVVQTFDKMLPPALSQQFGSNVNVKAKPINTIAEDDINVAPMQRPLNLSQCVSCQLQKNAMLSDSSGNESKTTVKKAYNRQGKENDPPKSNRRAQHAANVVQDEQYFFEILYADTPHADPEQMHIMAKVLASLAGTNK